MGVLNVTILITVVICVMAASGLVIKDEQKMEEKYFIAPMTAPFNEAIFICEEQNAQLVIVETERENTEIKIKIGERITNPAWTAGNRTDSCSGFVWQTRGQPVDYTDFVHSSEQDKIGCIYYDRTLEHGLKWRVGDCNQKFLVICERP